MAGDYGDLYLLDEDRHVVPHTGDFVQWCLQRCLPSNRVGMDQIGEVWVSTVFIGLDMGLNPDHPLVFETMIFGGPEGGWQQRSATWADAEVIHEIACDLVREKGKA